MSTEYCWRSGLLQEGDDQRALVMQPNGRHWVVLEGTAVMVWQAFRSPRSVSDAAAECMKAFRGDRQAIMEDIRLIVADWEARELLVRIRAD